MTINPDTAILDAALDEIAQVSQYVPEPQSYIEKRKLLAEIRTLANGALLAFVDVEFKANVAAAEPKAKQVV
jgi:hypothetical protein